MVWWAQLALLRAHHIDLLDAAEQGRRPGYLRAADRDRFTLGAALLRLAVTDEVGGSPVDLVVDRRCESCGRPHGKPTAPGTDLHVSISHSDELVAVAVTRAGPVGVDVEKMSTMDYEPLLDQVLAPGEEIHSAADFFTCWTRKESVLKATGDGLLTSMREVRVSPPGTPPELLRYASTTRVATMTDLRPPDGYRAAVTVLTAGPLDVSERSAQSLLR